MDEANPVLARKGRGAVSNRAGRFEEHVSEPVDDGWDRGEPHVPPLPTTLQVDQARSVITRNDSPDVPFDQSVNPYRGCEHGCVYCFARPSHAYLGLSAGLDFETHLFAKPDAPSRLEEELRRPGYRCGVLALGTNTDPYQPVERDMAITRGILEVLARFRHPVSIVTKSALVERDIDLLAPMAADGLAEVAVSVTTLDRGLARRMEPRACSPQRRVETIARLAQVGIPTGVLVAPVIPVLTDGELETILKTCAKAGATSAAYILLRLPGEVRGLFEEWLHAHESLKAARVLSQMRDTRNGKLYDPHFGARMTGTGPIADLIGQRFRLAVKRLGFDRPRHRLDTAKFVRPGGAEQLALF